MAPITLVGLTALSVEISTNVSTSLASAASAACQVLEDVVVDARDDVLLDDRHVLVGSRVVDRLHAVGLHDLGEPVAVMRIAEQRGQLEIKGFVLREQPQLPLDAVESQLGHLEQHQPARPDTRDLSAEFRPDRATRTRHHHDLVADAGVEKRLDRRDGLATQEIVRFDVAHVLELRVAQRGCR